MIPQGFSFAAVNAGVKAPDVTRLDMGLVFSTVPANAAAVFTTNRVKAAPVQIGMEIIRGGTLRAILANSGNANACTGPEGIAGARALMQAVADELKIQPHEVFSLSTGVIGVELPVARMLPKVPALVQGLGDNPTGFVASIMTTDTFPKCVYHKAGAATVMGIAKGAGMIAPNMATTLAVVLTDARLTSAELSDIIRDSIQKTFNAVTIDGDTSTNDTLVALASGLMECDKQALQEAIHAVLHELALMIVKDGEGATKLVEIRVTGASSEDDARTAAKAVANSLLVKTALFGQDPNWGRIVCAVGYSGVPIDPTRIAVKIAGLEVVRQGKEAPGFDEQAVHVALGARDIPIEIDLGAGPGAFTVWTTDISYRYVEINAAYRT